MNRALATAAVVVLLLIGACGDDENQPQRPTTGDSIKTPTSAGPSSTNP